MERTVRRKILGPRNLQSGPRLPPKGPAGIAGRNDVKFIVSLFETSTFNVKTIIFSWCETAVPRFEPPFRTSFCTTTPLGVRQVAAGRAQPHHAAARARPERLRAPRARAVRRRPRALELTAQVAAAASSTGVRRCTRDTSSDSEPKAEGGMSIPTTASSVYSWKLVFLFSTSNPL